MPTNNTNANATVDTAAVAEPVAQPAVGAALVQAADKALPNVLEQLKQAQREQAARAAKAKLVLDPVQYVCDLLGDCAKPLETRQQIAKNIANTAMFGYIYANAPEREQDNAKATALADLATLDLSFLAPVGTEQLDLSASREHRSEYFLYALACAYDEATSLAKQVMAAPQWGMPMQLQDVAQLVLQSAGTSSMDAMRNEMAMALLTEKQKLAMSKIREAEAATERSKWLAVLPSLLRNLHNVMTGITSPSAVDAHPAIELRLLQKLDDRLSAAADRAALGIAKVGKSGAGELYARIAALNNVQRELERESLVDRACRMQPEVRALRDELVARGLF